MFLGATAFIRVSQAQNSITADLLNLPSPPPSNPQVEMRYKRRTADFYKSSQPKDDAPIDDLLDYWRVQNESYRQIGYNIQPSDKSLERMFAAIEKKPETLINFLNVLPDKPEAADFVKRIYDRVLAGGDSEKYQLEQLKQWLTYHSDYFSDDLLKLSQEVTDTSEYVTNQEALLALGKVDWEKAEPIVNRLYNDGSQPVSQILASWILYKHALDTDSLSDIERYRAELKAMVENKSAKPGMRDLAMDALVHSPDFKERDDWYFSLLEDETLADLRVNGQSYTGLTTLVMSSPPDKYVEKMLELVKSGNAAARNAAVRNLATLLNEKNPEIVKALLPWLEDPKWAKEVGGERRQLVAALEGMALPESVPGLIAVLNEKSTHASASSAVTGSSNMSSTMKMNANVMNSNIMVDSVPEEEKYPFRDAAISALAVQKDVRAVPALRSVMPEIEVWQRSNVIRALLACGGFSVSEQIEALEAIAENFNSKLGAASLNNANTPILMREPGIDIGSNMMVDEPPSPPPPGMMNTNMAGGDYSNPRAYNPSDIKFMLGSQLMTTSTVSDELVTAVADRITELETKKPRLAFILRKIIQRWNGAGLNALLLRDLRNDKTDVDGIVKLLSLRKELRENQPNEIYAVRSGGSSTAVGIAACLLENNSDYDGILTGGNAETKTAMLACARLIRARLPIRKVAENVQSPNKLLALAAERYLESEDSPEAQAIVFSLYPDKAKILGATAAFTTGTAASTTSNFLAELFVSVDESFGSLLYVTYEVNRKLGVKEKELQKEVQENQELLGVYAYDGNFIRIYKDKAVFSWEGDEARYNERTLSSAEFATIKNYLASQRVNELAPFLSLCEEGCESKELLMLGRQGGRRIFVRSDSPPDFFAELDRMFAEMRKPPAELHYRLEKNIAGLEILFADKNLQARTLWKNGSDFRVLIDDTEQRKQIDKELKMQDEADAEAENVDYEKADEISRKRRARREFENLTWYQVGKGKLDGSAAAPPQIEYLPPRDDSTVTATAEQWKARTPNFEIRADENGLYKNVRGRATKILSGFFDQPVVTPNGRWVIVTKYGGEDGENVLVRVNLLTNKQFPITLKKYPRLSAVAAIPAVNKILILANNYEYDEESAVRDDYFLLDAETGVIEAARGEISPLAQQTFRPLQPTAAADEFWAAIPNRTKKQTQVGIYNAETFSFKSKLEIPQILFDSMDLWVDEQENKIYFVYKGQLLGLKMMQQEK